MWLFNSTFFSILIIHIKSKGKNNEKKKYYQIWLINVAWYSFSSLFSSPSWSQDWSLDHVDWHCSCLSCISFFFLLSLAWLTWLAVASVIHQRINHHMICYLGWLPSKMKETYSGKCDIEFQFQDTNLKHISGLCGILGNFLLLLNP